ncbi:hypothetical protein A5636_11930 [Mycobacterium asiaticum]|uniref:Pyrrolo-quinoline quinone n=1 Tax=Mycobacterium asiaticum TaxID=1790 RepID=A0A1A3MT46_MYCAS|nr:hypothetical protein A5636_11930 [Mycobacterium asiaticum]
MIALVGAGVAIALYRPFGGGGHGAEAAAPAPIGTPRDLLVSFSLQRQPVPGWQLSGADIGLPAGANVGELFTTNGNKAYFLTVEGCDRKCLHPTGWLYGLETTTGARLFPPLALPDFFGSSADCYANGPSVAVCTTRVPEGSERFLPPAGAWVIDLDRGAVTHHGPNTLNPRMSGGARLEAVGYKFGPAYLVAQVPGEGLHGVGPHAELTWFRPGSSETIFPATWSPDVPQLTLAVQPPEGVDDDRGERVFSVVDGKDLTPAPPQGTRLEEAVVYAGGFAYQFDAGKVTGALMYDTTGRQVGRQQPERSYPAQNAAMLTLAVADAFQIYDAAGKLVASIPSRGLSKDFRTIGSKLFVRKEGSSNGSQAEWQAWDLLTGQRGATCTMAFGSSYTGSDGTVVVTMREDPAPATYVAIDTTTCQTLWEMPGKIWIHKVGTGLIKVDRERAMVASLGAPA